MSYNVNIVNVSLEDMSSIIRNILAEELKKVGDYLKPEISESEESNQFLTRKEVCIMLNVSTTTLYLWNKSKTLVNHKIGRKVYYNKSDVFSLHNPKNVA
jgi:excisionase family DNA binding protein